MEEWKKLEKSLEKLKSISPVKRTGLKENSGRGRTLNYSPIGVAKPLLNYT